ncbi:MAG: sigma 54-interacting transcriptional regulator, partial [Nitrospirota bacterium]
MNKAPDLKGLDILVFENDYPSLKQIESDLKGIGADVYTAETFEEALGILHKSHIEVIIAAIDLVDEQCIEMIKEYKSLHPEALFYVLAGKEYDSVESTQESVRLIVDDYIKKPLDVVRFARMVETSIGRPDTAGTSLTVIDPLVAKVKPYFIFRSPVMRRTLYHLPQIAASEQAVLITGETGTGKELIARAIHVLSRRSSGPFIPINCG